MLQQTIVAKDQSKKCQTELLIDWQDIAIKYPIVFKEIVFYILSLNQVTKEWFETSQGQRISQQKVIDQMNKQIQDKVYEQLLVFFNIRGHLLLPIFPYYKNKKVWYRFELFDLQTLNQEDNFVRCQEGFDNHLECKIAIIKSAIDYMALKV